MFDDFITSQIQRPYMKTVILVFLNHKLYNQINDIQERAWRLKNTRMK